MNSDHFFACILAGGSGERFWPMSRARKPKHLLKLLSERTLLEETARRLEGVVPLTHIYVLTSEAQLADVRAALPFLVQAQIIAEPARRDTGPAAALATGLIRARDPQAVVALLAADAFIADIISFRAQLEAALAWTAENENFLLTFGIKPTFPSTGFGYLELGGELSGGNGAAAFRRISRFVEKPDALRAALYVASGNFVWKATALLAAAEIHAPELAAFIHDFPTGDFTAYLAYRFPGLPKTSVDYAIMEKAEGVATLLAEFDWDDVGSWTALPKHLPADSTGNTLSGPVVAVDSTNTIAVSSGRVIALCGVKDLVVVETADAILVCHRGAVEEIKKLLPLLPKEVT